MKSYINPCIYVLMLKKQKNMEFGKGATPSLHVRLNGDPIPWVKKWVYIGLTLRTTGSSFDCCVKEKIAMFYCSLNSILRIEGKSDDMVMLRLLEAHCLPILSYGIKVIHERDIDLRRKLRVAYNSIYRKVFGYTRRESVTELQHCLSRPKWEELIEKRKLSFQNRLSFSPINSLVRAFSS